MLSLIRLLMAIVLLVAGGAQALSQDLAQNFGVSELRAGFHAHSIDELGPSGEILNLTNWEDVTFEVLFRSPDVDAFRWIGSPKPNFGATISLAGKESMVHLGLTWQVPLFDTAIFFEGTLGGALHNGALTGAAKPLRNLGCSLLFYQSAGIGVQVSDNMNVMLAWEHASSANVCAPNRGLTDVGIKVGYRF